MPVPVQLTGRIFTRTEASTAEITDDRLRRLAVAGTVRHLRRGVWSDASLLDDELHRLAGLTRVAPYVVASHATAARLWGAGPADERLHVTVPADASLRSATGLVVHRDRLGRHETTVHQGVAVTDPYRTAIDIARAARRPRLAPAVEVVDALLFAERVEHRHLTARLAGTPSGRGIAIAREVIGLSRYGAQSPAETRLRLALLAGGVPEPRLQYRIDCRGGVVVADMCWPARRLVVEYDGFAPHTERATFERDRRRWSWLRADGWDLRAYTAESIRDRKVEIAAEVLGLLSRSPA